ncbi:uroporphyrinogen-III C-methyltransferase [Acidiphilium sp. AL]|uniref:uroporphyrinogen-III C-methyltransferase n=1 Tax=Acidiphilium sp. AL TaxID=2871704 RepID=UPI0021CB6030|nr:uroporphyrinogen-III C-methyltransferase [Acidiphilium sp. AL]MCU4158564.1 uroporphyrinogen-III C-methyltransferase [Acidiphilium sp. AL]
MNRFSQQVDREIHPVVLAGAGPGDPELLTVKALRAIEAAEVILHDALVEQRILALAPTARLVNVGKRCGHHAMKQHEINASLIAEAMNGARVLRLKGGDPMIFGRASEEIAALRAADIEVVVIPGITAASAAASSIQASLTSRDVARSVIFITGHGSDGSLPEQDWPALARMRSSFAFYMGARHARAIAERLIDAGLDPATPGVIVTNISRPDERYRNGRLIDLADGIAAEDLTSPALILIGAAFDAAFAVQPARSLTCKVKVMG